MMNVARSKHTLRGNHSRHFAHQFGYRLLVVIAVASHVVGHIKRHVALQLLPLGTHVVSNRLRYGSRCHLSLAARRHADCALSLHTHATQQHHRSQ